MTRALLVLLLLAVSACSSLPRDPGRGRGGEVVVLVHGLGRTPLSMLPMEMALEREGYEVLNWGYTSTSRPIPLLGAALAADVATLARARPGRRIHFVGHSMGNILIRWVLVHQRPSAVGRVVMLAPPNQGARAADRFAPWVGWLLRPLPELRTAPGSTVRTLPAPSGVEIGIVAARGDGKVRVEETALPGVRERVLVGGGHTFIMARRDVRRLTLRFLENGRFAPAATTPPAE